MNEQALFRIRVGLIQVFLHRHHYDGILLSRIDNFAMATGGRRNYVPTATDLGGSSLFVTKEGRACFVGNNIERTRVVAEELQAFGCEVRDFLWFDGNASTLLKKEFSGTLVSDDGALGENVNGKLAYLRALLTEAELEKYRRLGALAADAVTTVAQQVRVGQTEADIAGMLITEGARRRCLVPIALIAADERIAQHRHPLPIQVRLLGEGLAEKPVKGYVMIVGGFLREGLVTSISRFVRVGDTPAGVGDAHERICAVDAVLQEGSRPGRTLGDVFNDCLPAYPAQGFAADEWHNHHQGGMTGYAGRTCKGAPGESFPILDLSWATDLKAITGIDTAFGHAFAWNPSAPGVKSEDTFILCPDGTQEIVTTTPAFPSVDVCVCLGRDTVVHKSGIMDRV